MADFQIIFPSDFNATTLTFVAKTKEAQARIYGGVSAEIFKSAAQEFCDTLKQEGFVVEVI
jgi:hypothetical protein